MSVQLNFGAGDPQANTYADQTWADTYHSMRLFVSTWSGADTPTKTAALLQACKLLDLSFRWTGQAATSTQKLCWPRIGMLDRNGNVIDSSKIPDELKDAQSELARRLIDDDRQDDNIAHLLGITSVRAGNVGVNFEPTESGRTVQMRNADVIRKGRRFDYLDKAIPQAVRVLLVPTWYSEALVSQPLIFTTHR